MVVFVAFFGGVFSANILREKFMEILGHLKVFRWSSLHFRDGMGFPLPLRRLVAFTSPLYFLFLLCTFFCFGGKMNANSCSFILLPCRVSLETHYSYHTLAGEEDTDCGRVSCACVRSHRF